MLSRLNCTIGRKALQHTGRRVQVRAFTPSVSRQVVDQTKQNNDSSQPQKEEHRQQSTKAGKSSQSDLQSKQPDPQASPSKSTGIETDGPGGSKAGTGPEPDVYKNEDVKKMQAKKEQEGGRESSMVRGAAKGESLAEGSNDSSSKKEGSSPFSGEHGARHVLDKE